MIIEIRHRPTGKITGVRYVCHGCGVKSKVYRRPNGYPVGWVDRWESHYSGRGRRTITGKLVNNHYCRACHTNGVNAYAVAAVTRKLTARKHAG